MNIDANVRKIVFALMKKWKFIVIFAIIGALLGYIYTANFTKLTYTSSVEFLAYAVDSQQEFSDSTQNGDYARTSNTSKMNYAMKMLDTYVEVMNTYEFNTKVANQLNKRLGTDYDPTTIKNALTFETIDNTAMFKITVTTLDSSLSYEIAHQLESSVPQVMEETNNGLVLASVEDKAIKANSAGSLGYPKKVAFGAIAGIVLSAAGIILKNLLDIRIKSEEELTEKYNIPVLGSIPNYESKALQNSSKKKGGK